VSAIILKSDWVIHPIKGKKPLISWESVDDLKVDSAYQRAIDSPASQRLIKEVASNWDWGLCSVLTVSDRGDDGLFVVDGQHRLHAAKLRSDIPHLPCVTAKLSSQKEEAQLFVSVNTARKTITPLDRFHARCIAGDKETLEIARLVAEAGLRVGKSPYKIGDGEITEAPTMMRVYRDYGAALFSASLVNMAEAWPGQGLRIAREMLPALCLLLKANYPGVDPENIPATLRSREQAAWFAGGFSAHNEDTENDLWPDEVFCNIVYDAYMKKFPGTPVRSRKVRTISHDSRSSPPTSLPKRVLKQTEPSIEETDS